MKLEGAVIAVIGLGFVGLPLAVEFGRQRRVIGFDRDETRVAELARGLDRTAEVTDADLKAATRLELTSDEARLAEASVFIVAVPTPVDEARQPDLDALRAASRTVGEAMREGAVIVFESTVYPGCTRAVCVPELEEASGLKLNEGFFVGYSPERVNPGDKTHRLTSVTKVTSGSTAEAAEAIDRLYASIVEAGTHRASSIEVAEAAKVIENTQRDLNIALMNELAIIFHRLDLDSAEVLEAAGTKWNFMPFRPGLVGGHCIGVDPYYLTHRAQQAGYHPEIILAGRRINDGMGPYVADRVARLMTERGLHAKGGRVLVMGLTFKENCPDLRNSRVVDVVEGLRSLGADVDVWDPHADPADARAEYGIEILTERPGPGAYDAVVMAVSHDAFVALGAPSVRAFGRDNAVFFDVKGAFGREASDGRL